MSDQTRIIVDAPHVTGTQRADKTLTMELCLNTLLNDCANGLHQASRETRDETDGLPRNLLAAFNRVSSHVEYFLRATNPDRSKFQSPDETKPTHIIEKLREDAADKLELIGSTLRCSKGFIEPESINADDARCDAWLEEASNHIKELAFMFEQTRTEILSEVGTTSNGMPHKTSKP